MRAANALYIYIMKAKQPIARDSHIGIFQDTFALGHICRRRNFDLKSKRRMTFICAHPGLMIIVCRKLPQQN